MAAQSDIQNKMISQSCFLDPKGKRNAQGNLRRITKPKELPGFLLPGLRQGNEIFGLTIRDCSLPSLPYSTSGYETKLSPPTSDVRRHLQRRVRRRSYHNAIVMSDDGNQPVCDLRDAIASALQTDPPTDSPSVLTAWIIIAEYASADGSRYIVQRNGAAPDSDHSTTPWQRRGMLYEVLDTGLIEDEQDIVFELDDEDGDDE